MYDEAPGCSCTGCCVGLDANFYLGWMQWPLAWLAPLIPMIGRSSLLQFASDRILLMCVTKVMSPLWNEHKRSQRSMLGGIQQLQGRGEEQRQRGRDEEDSIHRTARWKAPAATGPTADLVRYGGDDATWSAATAALGWGSAGALTLALLRLVMWHWLQPAICLSVIHATWDELDPLQTVLAAAAGLRACLAVLVTLCVCCSRPSFLLVDVRAGWRQGGHARGWSTMYVLAPEMVALFVLGNATRSCRGAMRDAGAFIFAFTALGAGAALLAALGTQDTEPPPMLLRMAYAVHFTALFGLFLPGWGCCGMQIIASDGDGSDHEIMV